MRMLKERGFTLLEAVVVIAVLIILLAVSLIFVRPKSFAGADNDVNRRLGLAVIAQGVSDYRHKKGTWPAHIPAKTTPITNQSGGYDLCSSVVPAYLKDMAYDPELGAAFTGDTNNPEVTAEACNVEGVRYNTGFTIRKNSDDSVTFSAPAARQGAVDITLH